MIMIMLDILKNMIKKLLTAIFFINFMGYS